MAKAEAAVIDFGSSKITVLIGARGVNNTFSLRGMGECAYEGFSDGEFLVPAEIKGAVLKAVSQAETVAQTKIRHAFVGVPGEFASAAVKDGAVSFKQRKRVAEEDIEELFDNTDIFKNHASYTVINRAPVYFTLDDSRRIIDPAGSFAAKLSGRLSYILADNKFIRFTGGVLDELGIARDFVSSSLAEALYLLEPETRDAYAVLVDCGHITTSVMLVRGDGLLFLKSFSLGGYNITIDLAQVLTVTSEKAERLKTKVKLSREAADGEEYSANERGSSEEQKFPAALVHDVVSARIEDLADTVAECLAECSYEYPAYTPVYLTGGGLAHIRGAKEILARRLSRPVEIALPANIVSAKPEQSSSFGVLELALKHVKPAPVTFWDKLFKRKNKE